MKRTGVLVMACLLTACAGTTNTAARRANRGRKARPISVELGKVFEKGNRTLLYGGKLETSHFDITKSSLKSEQLHYGIGREVFQALTEPRFDSAKKANRWLKKGDRVLALKDGKSVKVYPISLLKHHEVVNDVVDGRAIFAAYCILADLGAVYERTLAGRTHTFALSGYTYFDPKVWEGLDGFVLWDRETESLWWPQSGKAVSGPMLDAPMRVLDEARWSQTTWGEINSEYPDARVLAKGQKFTQTAEQIKFGNKYKGERFSGKAPEDAIAPHWGGNKAL
ncbi:MAG: hypothetical protein COB53_01210 [Elusimicrobia bacterium]|nr:MAG: hypothetical protein COB53_01210 [Elusimicrobiota bacterium]